MTNSQSYSHSSYSSSSYSSTSSSSNIDGLSQSHSQRYTTTSHHDSDRGTTTTSRYEETGKPTVEERTEIPAGRSLGSAGGGQGQGRIQDVSDDADAAEGEQGKAEVTREMQAQAERMEDEYAKREG